MKAKFELTAQEQKAYNEYEELKSLTGIEQLEERNNKKREILYKHPKICNFKSFFPNQFINPILLKTDEVYLDKLLKDFEELVNNKTSTERNILNFLKDEKLFIIASIVKDYADWGHHDLYVFPEFQLGTFGKVDYLIVGKNSYGYNFMFVELKNIYGKITIDSGDFGKTIRDGINQIEDRKIWIEKYFNQLHNEFKKFTKKNLPNEFREYDSTRISYIVLAGKRTDFKEKTYRLRQNKKDNEKIIILHYDNIIDLAKNVLKSKDY